MTLVVHSGASGGQTQTSCDEREHISLLFTLHDSCYDINNSGLGLQTANDPPLEIFLVTVVIMASWCAPTGCLIGSPLGAQQRAPLPAVAN